MGATAGTVAEDEEWSLAIDCLSARPGDAINVSIGATNKLEGNVPHLVALVAPSAQSARFLASTTTQGSMHNRIWPIKPIVLSTTRKDLVQLKELTSRARNMAA
jgi:hypothetical protein